MEHVEDTKVVELLKSREMSFGEIVTALSLPKDEKLRCRVLDKALQRLRRRGEIECRGGKWTVASLKPFPVGVKAKPVQEKDLKGTIAEGLNKGLSGALN